MDIVVDSDVAPVSTGPVLADFGAPVFAASDSATTMDPGELMPIAGLLRGNACSPFNPKAGLNKGGPAAGRTGGAGRGISCSTSSKNSPSREIESLSLS